MRTMKVVAAISLLAVGMAFGQSVVTYQIEVGGDNHSGAYESKASPMPGFTSGVTDNTKVVNGGDDLTWAVRVTVDGAPESGPGTGKPVLGGANLVFDLQLFQADGVTPVPNFGAAPLACTSGTPGGANAKNCKPTAGGFWSTINDGDSDDPNNGAYRLDTLANAAFAWGIWNGPEGYPPPAGTQLLRLIDTNSAGPRFDYGWYPTSNGRGGVDTDGSKPINTGVTTVNSQLVGFGAGYKSYDGTNHMVGVGVDLFELFNYGYGVDRPLFEGQINTTGLPSGTYVLKVVPSADGTNVVHGDVDWSSATPNYGGAGSFAVKANSVVGSSLSFTVNAPPPQAQIVARKVFYNQSGYDGNRATIDAAPTAGDRNDDGDAIDMSKSPLMVGGGLNAFAAVSGYNKGLTGLVYDVKLPSRAPVLADFAFANIGRDGLAAPTAINPAAIAIWPGAGVSGSDRVFISFAANTVPLAPAKAAWVQVTIGTGFGLALPETHYWGFAPGDTGPAAATNMLVNSTDVSNIGNNPTTPSNRSPVSDPNDVDKSSLCNATDGSWVGANQTTPSTCLKQISK